MTRRTIASLIAVATLATVASVVPSSAVDPAAGCVSSPQTVEVVGTACRTADGLWAATLDDGFTVTTHGPDPVGIHGMYEMLKVKRRNPSCASDPRSMYHIQVLYTTTSDQPDRYSQRLGYVQRMMERVNGMLYREGAEFGAPMLYRMACVRGRVSVRRANKLSFPSGPAGGATRALDGTNFINIVAELRRQGYTNPFAKYWIFVDSPEPFEGLGGIASFINDDRLIAENASNYGPGYGVFWDVGEAFTTEAMMHEASHLNGVVANSAPNSSAQFGGGAHCVDDSDVMCYNDWGGPVNDPNFKWSKCKKLHYDCGHNDYFNPRPRRGSYLATHWNLGSPLNRFYAGCSYTTGLSTAGVLDRDETASAVEPVRDAAASTRSVTIARKCRGRPFALTGAFSPQPREADQAVGTVPDTHNALFLFGSGPPDHIINGRRCTAQTCVTPGPDFNVCFYRGSTRLSCFTELGTDQGTVPRTATKAVVSFNVGARGTWILSII